MRLPYLIEKKQHGEKGVRPVAISSGARFALEKRKTPNEATMKRSPWSSTHCSQSQPIPKPGCPLRVTRGRQQVVG